LNKASGFLYHAAALKSHFINFKPGGKPYRLPALLSTAEPGYGDNAPQSCRDADSDPDDFPIAS
jgi:hypothetical protein